MPCLTTIDGFGSEDEMMNFNKVSTGWLVASAMAVSLLGSASALAQTEVKIGYALSEILALRRRSRQVAGRGRGQHRWPLRVQGILRIPASAASAKFVEGVQIGTVEATIVSSGTLSNFVPEVGVTDIPLLFRSLDHARNVLDGEIGQGLLARFDDVGLVAMAWGEQGFRHITNNRGPIGEPGDMAGLKLRTMENPVHITAFETLGAAPTPMAWPEVIARAASRARSTARKTRCR